MVILGLSGIGHDAAAALLVDGEVVAAVEEERITRIKNAWTFPVFSVNEALSIAGLKTTQIDRICFYWNDKDNLLGAIRNELKYFFNPKMPSFARIKNRFRAVHMQKAVVNTIKKEFFSDESFLPKIEFIDHHLSHIAYAFFCSGFESAAGLIVDGRGEYSSISAYNCVANKFNKVFGVNMPNSLGFIYAAVTQHLGFAPLSDEYRVMGLASYGEENKKLDNFFDALIKTNKIPKIEVDLQYCNFQNTENLKEKWLSHKSYDFLGEPRSEEQELNSYHANIAFALQKKIENVIFELTNYLYTLVPNKNIVLGGGVAMNSVCNGKISLKSPFENIFIPPAPSDQGCAIGAALYSYNKNNNSNQYIKKNRTPYLGREYSDQQILEILKSYKISYVRPTNLMQSVAELIASGKICGLFQQRMEFGSRALGNRSILADPRNKEMKDKINVAIKFREKFRPFAATLLDEHSKYYIENYVSSPYMSFVTRVTAEKRDLIPAVVHIDGTCRFQTLRKKDNPFYYAIIEEFYKLTNIPLVLNTSFNIKGEPIVMSPTDAIRCFYSTGLDYLVIGSYILAK
jgi:carbamoyltransferase